MKRTIIFIVAVVSSVCLLAQNSTDRAKLFVSDVIKYCNINFVCKSTVAIQGDNLIISILEFPVFNQQSQETERRAAAIELKITNITSYNDTIVYNCISSDGNNHSQVWFSKTDSDSGEITHYIENKNGGQQEWQEFVRLKKVKKVE